MRKKLFGCALVAAALGAVPSPASADDTRCVGVLVAGTFDNVVVPRNMDCALTGSIVRGNVKAREGSSLFSSSNQIAGSLEGDHPRWVGSLGDSIGGNFDVVGATGPGFGFEQLSVNVFVCGTSLSKGNIAVEKSRGGTVAVGSLLEVCPGNDVAEGNIKVQENLIPAPEVLAVDRNTVDGNVQVFKNRGNGMKTVTGNVVRENLQCKENDPPFAGGPNLAAKAEDQCF
jgi:hypothetical protein